LIEDGGFRGIVRGQLQTVRAWLNTLPDTLVRERAWLCILSAVTLLFTNDLAGAEARLQAAERCIQPDAPADQAGAMLGHVATIRGAIVHFSGDLARSVALAERALDLLPAAESLSRPLALVIAAHAYRVSGDVTPAAERAALAIAEPMRASGNLLAYLGAFLNLAELRVVQGRLREAAASYREAAEVALGSGGLHVMVGSPAYYFGMADLLREWNDLDAAERHLAQGMELLRGALTVHADVAALGAIVQARLQHARGDGTSALATLETFADLARRRGFDELVIARGAAAQAQLALAQDDLAAALRWAHGYAESSIQAERSSVAVGESSLDSRRSIFLPVYPHELEDLVLARVWIAQGRDAPERRQIQEALELLDRLLRAAESGGRTGAVVEIQILQALAHQAHGDLRSALAAIERALKLAAPAGYVRLFVDEGASMAELVAQSAKRRARSDPIKAYIERLLAAFPAGPGTGLFHGPDISPVLRSALERSNAFVEPPTERELAVLRLIAEGLSNREIADRLVIAVGTVKRHVNNLFGKLGVQSRTQAIRVAQDHGLL
ncbi:MAG TPA: LuxR C-terminal-related transcriptional regulator, partial [Roseiflexaceae bacterium]